ncbi:unnamed protein product [Brachionus calyciflorus]|uniref:Gametogenetin-binding protein 2 n=1 Tax=Brachionus calyciflorus TaxID=104777 RepID=A0A813XU56_9BILA|nr:unnamed protein product [Brachionus calyciflorus]
MTRLLNVVQNDEICEDELQRRQIPFDLPDLPKMIVTFDDIISCLACELEGKVRHGKNLTKNVDYAKFLERFNQTYNETNLKLEINLDELMLQVSQTVGCISCRTSVEKLFKQIVPKNKNFYSLALDPIQIDSNGLITIKSSLFKPESIYTLLYIDSSNLDSQIDLSRKSSNNSSNKRCQLHLIDSQKQIKQKRIDDWVNVWKSLETNDCRKQMTIIDCAELLETINQYLKRNKFCCDCKFKVLVAYKILTCEAEIVGDDGTYKPSIFDGIFYCTESDKKPHLHVKPDRDFIAALISKAESEIKELRPERHAKTIDIAQDEILICIGLHLYERFFQIGQSLRIVEQSWKILFYSSVQALKKRLDFEINQFENLDSLCAELEAIGNPSKTKSKKIKPKKQKEKIEQKHTCTSSKKSTKLNLSDSQSPVNSPECSEKPSCTNKAKKNLEIKEDCYCDDQNEFVHAVDEKNDVNCEMSCCFDIIQYWNKLVQEDEEKSKWNVIENKKSKGKKNACNDLSDLDKGLLITDKEKQEYYKNKSFYLNERMNRRELLENKFKMLKLSSSFKLESRQKSVNSIY